MISSFLIEFGFRFVKQSFRARSECGPEVVRNESAEQLLMIHESGSAIPFSFVP